MNASARQLRPAAVRARRAYTLLEVLLVVALIGMLAAFTWPNFANSLESEQLDQSVRRIQSLVQMARAQAMNEAREYQLVFRPDGTLWVTRQVDPLLAPQITRRFRAPWLSEQVLLDGVWVSAIKLLPDGPPPILIEDEIMEFDQDEFDEPPDPIEDFSANVVVRIRPDGRSDSLRWVLRDERGHGVMMTLEGRLGRIAIEAAEALQPGELEQPEALPLEEESLMEFESDYEVPEERRV